MNKKLQIIFKFSLFQFVYIFLIYLSITPCVVKAASQSEQLEKDMNWDFNSKTKTLRIKNEISNLEYDYLFIENEAGYKYSGSTPWDSYKNQIVKITIDEGIKTLPLALFSDLKNLKEVTLPSTLTEIPKFAFYNCNSLTKIELPDSVHSIGFEAFYNCSSLKSITFGKSLESIGINTFGGCYLLKKINLSSENKYLTIKNGILYDKKLKILLLAPPQAVNSVIIPKTVEVIGSHAFANCKNLKQIYIPYNVKEISEGAFYNCTNLKSITFAKNSKCKKISDFLEYYGDDFDEIYGAFENCKSLTKLSLPDNLRTIGTFSLNHCSSLKTIKFGSKFDSVSYLEKNTSLFSYEGLSNLTTIDVSYKNKKYSSSKGILFNKSKTKLIWYPSNRNYKTYSLPIKVKEISPYAFENNKKLVYLNLSSVEKIGYYAFRYSKKLETVQWSKKLKLISGSAFESCKNLKSFTSYGNNLKIEDNAFYNCTSLKTVNLKSGTRYIGFTAFFNCSFKKVTIPPTVTTIKGLAFGFYQTNETKKIKNFIIYCKRNSAAYQYIIKYELKYKYY